MRQSSKLWRVIIGAIAVMCGIVLLGWALMLPAVPEPPMLPDDEPSAQALPSSTSTESAKPSASPTKSELANPRGNPVRVTITSANGKRLISARMQPIHTQPDGRLVPPGGIAGWLADSSWPKPGVLSRYRSIVAGHVSGGGKPDIFYNLPQIRKGDTAVITYDSGDRVIARITNSPVNVGKDDVSSDPKYDWVWEGKKKARVVSFFTCNVDAAHVNGHSVENWVTQGEVVDVIAK